MMTKKKVPKTAADQIQEWKAKAEKWDALDREIWKYYNEDEEGKSEKEGDLIDIGEVAARAFGYR